MKNDVKPVYLKLRDVIAAAILDGNYKEGQMLPSVRAFAADQGANPLTVAKAYQLFQDSGLVDVKPLISATLSYRDPGRAFALAADRSQAMKVLLDFD